MNEYDISQAFEEIEKELIDSMMKNFSRHRAEETKEGYNWSQWQAEQFKSLEQYRKNNSKKFNKQFSELNGKVEEMLKTARANGNAEQEAKILQAVKDGFKLPDKPSETSTAEFFKVNDRKLNALIKSTTDDLKSAETAVLRMSNDKYRSAIFNAQVYANSGAGTYEKAVDMACRDMLRAGLNCVEYKNGARHTLSDYAEMAIRTANKRAYLRGEGEKRQEFGITTVVVNSRQGGCPDCAPYIGRVFIDDVYSGGSAKDGDYPLLSEAISGGLFHPRCKDSTSTYYEGITTLKPATADEIDDMKRQEALEQQKSYCENQAKKCGRISEYSLDSDNKRAYAKRAEVWQEKAKENQKFTSAQSSSNWLVSPETSEAEIDKIKNNITEQEIDNWHEKQGYSYRLHESKDGLSSWGHAMFADDTSQLVGVYGGDEPNVFVIKNSDLVDMNDESTRQLFKKAWDNAVENEDEIISRFADFDEFYDTFNPTDIVESAGGWDDADGVSWVYNNVCEPNGITGFKTNDGAISFDPDSFKRDLVAEKKFTKEESVIEEIDKSVTNKTTETVSEKMQEYLDFKAAMESKYGDNIWSEMTDDEFEKLELLERIAYTGK